MRASRLVVLPLFVLATWACTGTSSPDPVGTLSQRIQGGTLDTGDSAVVGVLIGSGGQVQALCSGSLIGPNLVLTAHHCVADVGSVSSCGSAFGALYSASSFMVTTSYDAAAAVFNGAGNMPSADNTTWWGASSVAVPGDNICGDDIAALTLSAPISGVCPLIPDVDQAITDGETYEAVGFGITSPNGQTAGTRYDVTGMTVECVGATDCQDNTISANQEWEGGSSASKGTCEGDSGGPALDSLGRIIGTVSRGPSNACNQTVYEYMYGEAPWVISMAKSAATAGGYAVAGWVNGGATSSPANGYCGGGGADAGGPKDASTGQGPTTCSQADNTVGCCVGKVNYYCTASGVLDTTTCAGTTVCGWNSTRGYYACVAPPASSDPSGTYPIACGGTSPDAAASCGGLNTGNAACDTCLDGSCCGDMAACAADPECLSCLSADPVPTSCSSDAAYASTMTCVASSCAAACGMASPDAGITSDAGTGSDAATAPDASSGHDAATAPDASSGHDAATAPDASPGSDAAIAPDASHKSDAATAPDASSGHDAATTPDASHKSDAATAPDASTGSDAAIAADAGARTDARTASDATSTAKDSGARPSDAATGRKDARAASDAGKTSPDGGKAIRGASNPGSSGGCQAAGGKTTSSGSIAFAALAFAAVAARRRRKAGSR